VLQLPLLVIRGLNYKRLLKLKPEVWWMFLKATKHLLLAVSHWRG
jgi:hypothetical protein